MIHTDQHIKTIQPLSYSTLKSHISYAMANSFTIPSALHAELSQYKLTYWSADYLTKWLLLHNVDYSVVFIDTDLLHIKELASSDPNAQIRVSFRKARDHWNLPAYALIKLPAPKFARSARS